MQQYTVKTLFYFILFYFILFLFLFYFSAEPQFSIVIL